MSTKTAQFIADLTKSIQFAEKNQILPQTLTYLA
jgi:hypothetical protein